MFSGAADFGGGTDTLALGGTSRFSGTLANAEAWKSVIIDGALKDRGMVSFAKVLTPADAEAIRAYVIERSNWTKANLADSSAPMGR